MFPLQNHLQPTERDFKKFIVTIVITIVIFQGISVIDLDLPLMWKSVLGDKFDGEADRLYLVEGLLHYMFGVSLSFLKLPDRITWIVWWSCGLVMLIGAFVIALKQKSLDLFDILLIVTFSRLVDTVSMWIGKFDPYFLSFAILSASQSKMMSRTAMALAAFCHPSAAVVSSFGNVAVQRFFNTRADLGLAPIAIGFAAVDLVIAHRIIPGLMDRSGFLLNTLWEVIISGAQCGIVTLVSAFLIPCLSIQAVRPTVFAASRTVSILMVGWIAVAAAIACFLTLDHTRVACLITLGPLVTFLRLRKPAVEQSTTTLAPNFFLLAASRLVIPHVAGMGFFLFSWHLVGRNVSALLGRWVGGH